MNPNHSRQPHQHWSQQNPGKLVPGKKLISNPEEAKENILRFDLIEQKAGVNFQDGYQNVAESQVGS